jgi:hypothetical protein
MNGITGPAADTVFQAVGSTITAAGIEETAPRNDQEWEKVGDAAAALIESGNLMLMEGRMVDHGDWVRISKDLIAAGKVALEATRKKDADALLASGEAVNQSCDACHQTYRRN